MVCPRCGQALPAHADLCTACGAPLDHSFVLTGAVPVDTTGLPPGAMRGVSATTAGTTPLDDDAAATVIGARTPGRPAGTASLQLGQSFGARYHIIKLLGAGGMGAVYQAWDAELGVAVALKVIRVDRRGGSASPAAEKQFKQELILARQVTHKNVVRIHDLGEIDGVKYITMPYVEGADLGTVLQRDGKLPVQRALRIARQIAAGLLAAHEAGVVHRDLKPANIMVGADDAAMIMDFGISASSTEASTGGVVGTLEYMAPEQAAGAAVDGRADIYAFGLIVYEMLTGPRLVSESTPQARVASMKQRVADGLAPIGSVDPGIPVPLAAVVTRCLEHDPAARFQHAGDLVAALDRLDDAGKLIPLARRLTRRMVAAAVVAVMLLLGGTYLATRRLAAPPRTHDPTPVLIADFDNRSGEAAFEGAVEQTLGIALEGASYITVFKTRDARAIAAQLGGGSGARITQELGQLIARREGIKVLVGGRIDAQGSGYRVELRAIDPVNEKPIATTSRYVRDKTQVLAAVASMAGNIREALGESKSEMTKVAAAETVTAGSLDAMRAYARGQEALVGGKFQDALQAYQDAVTFDPRFGRAHAGIAGVYANYFKDREKADAAYQAAIRNSDRMTEREKYRTLGTYYLDIARNYEKGIENFETLVKLYPADDGGHGNLAFAYLHVGNLAAAQDEVRRSLEVYPKNSLQRYNYSMYSMYAGDFANAIAQAARVQQENRTLEYAWLPIAVSKLAQGDVAGAHDAYARMRAMSAFGASFATLGEADLAMYFGQHRRAIGLLRDGIAADKAGAIAPVHIARKYVALAEAHAAAAQLPQAREAAAEAVTLSRAESIAFPAARVLLRAGGPPQALQIARDLDNMLQRHATAYARIITGEHAIERGNLDEGIELIRDGQKRRDFWLTRYVLGQAYLAAGRPAEALAELEQAVKRRGETTDAFFDDLPTLRYLPPAYYWLGRAQEATGSAAAARGSYATFVNLYADADTADATLADARRRVAALQ
jgi:tetratricopeptide (TPR) repeat protein